MVPVPVAAVVGPVVPGAEPQRDPEARPVAGHPGVVVPRAVVERVVVVGDGVVRRVVRAVVVRAIPGVAVVRAVRVVRAVVDVDGRGVARRVAVVVGVVAAVVVPVVVGVVAVVPVAVVVVVVRLLVVVVVAGDGDGVGVVLGVLADRLRGRHAPPDAGVVPGCLGVGRLVLHGGVGGVGVEVGVVRDADAGLHLVGGGGRRGSGRGLRRRGARRAELGVAAGQRREGERGGEGEQPGVSAGRGHGRRGWSRRRPRRPRPKRTEERRAAGEAVEEPAAHGGGARAPPGIFPAPYGAAAPPARVTRAGGGSAAFRTGTPRP